MSFVSVKRHIISSAIVLVFWIKNWVGCCRFGQGLELLRMLVKLHTSKGIALMDGRNICMQNEGLFVLQVLIQALLRMEGWKVTLTILEILVERLSIS